MDGFGSLRIGYLMQNGAADLGELSGPQLHTLAVINGLKRLGHIVRVVAIQKNHTQWSDDLTEWHPGNYAVTRKVWFRIAESFFRRIQSELKLPFFGLFDSLHFADACRTHLKGFDVLYERHGYMGYGGVIAAHLLGIPHILELNGDITREIDERRLGISSIQRNIGRWITNHTFRAANCVVVVSDALKLRLVESFKISPAKVSVVINGFDRDLFSRSFEESEIRAQYGIDRKPIVAFVGSFEPWHGVNLLISSFRRINVRYPTSGLLIIGEGAGRANALTLASNLGLDDKVNFLGRLPQKEVAAVLSIANVLVAPYPFHHGDIVGTPLKLLEYMASGKGIIASTAPIHEIIKHGVTGLRVPPADTDALADAILKLLDDEALCASLGRNAEQQSQQYSWNNVVENLSKIIRMQMCKRKP